MPFKSKAQERWAFTAAGKKALGGKAKVNEWSQASSGMALPERASQAPDMPKRQTAMLKGMPK